MHRSPGSIYDKGHVSGYRLHARVASVALMSGGGADPKPVGKSWDWDCL